MNFDRSLLPRADSSSATPISATWGQPRSLAISKQREASSNPFALRSCSGCLVGDRGVDRTVRADLCDARGPHPAELEAEVVMPERLLAAAL